MSLPLENLDNKTFEQLVEEAKKRIPIYAPQWTDHNPRDTGITLIELFAWLLDMQIYWLNIVPDDAMWIFLKLVGIQKASEAEANGIETLDQTIIRARKDMKTVTRAVTSEDYETLALSTPGVNVVRAKAIPRYHPNMHQEIPGIVTVVVASSEPEPPQLPGIEFYQAVYRHLNQHRLLTTELFIIPSGYVEVSVQAEVVIKPEFLCSTVIENVNTGLTNFLHPLSGGSDGRGWPFGRPVYLSEIYEVIDRASGVDYVNTLALKKEKSNWLDDDIIISPHGLVYPGAHMITALEEQEEKNG
jgi:hypothetical protein